MHQTNKFPKNEKLCGEIRIGKLFAEGNAFIAYPLRVVYNLTEEEKQDAGVKVLINVPKKKIKKATQRNRIKRLIREAYRLNKSTLQKNCMQQNQILHIAFTYLAENLSDYKLIEEKIKYSTTKILQHITQ